MELSCIVKYRGILLVTIAQDGRNNIFPIAFTIVEGETVEACFFFLAKPTKICYSARWSLSYF